MATSSAGPQWELSKENAAPLERGRNASALSRALTIETEEERREKEGQMRAHETLVGPSEQLAERIASDDYGSSSHTLEDFIAQEEERDDSHSHSLRDSLVHWLSYIKFHQESYPSNTQDQFLLMERCTRALVCIPRYANDVRFIRVCIAYADKTAYPSDVFKFLHQKKIGTTAALFWVAWAWVAEKTGDFPFAEKVFRKGISKKAKPSQMLEERHKQFQRRMSRHWLNAASQPDDDDEEDGETHKRGALGGLTEDGVRRNHRPRQSNSTSVAGHGGVVGTSGTGRESSSMAQRTTFAVRGQEQRGLPPPPNNGVKGAKGVFEIFVEDENEFTGQYNLDQTLDEENDPRGRSRHRFAREADSKKENTLKAERWNERGGLGGQHRDNSSSRSGSPDSSPVARRRHARARNGTGGAFPVYVDEECVAKIDQEAEEDRLRRAKEKRESEDRALKQRMDARGSTADQLTKDPLRYVRNPSKYTSDRAHQKVSLSMANDEIKTLMKGDGGHLPYRRASEQTQSLPSLELHEARKENNNEDGGQPGKRILGFDKQLVKDSNKREQCFEEARGRARYFTLAPSCENFNILSSSKQENCPDDSAMDEVDSSDDDDVTMEEVSNSIDEGNTGLHAGIQTVLAGTNVKGALSLSEIAQSVAGTNSKVPFGISNMSVMDDPPQVLPQKVLFGLSNVRNNASFLSTSQQGNPNISAQDTSTASSTVNERYAVGVPEKPEEETINTKYARQNVSMMFYGTPQGENDHDDENDSQVVRSNMLEERPLFSTHKPLLESSFAAPSIYHDDEDDDDDDEEDGHTETDFIIAKLVNDDETVDISATVPPITHHNKRVTFHNPHDENQSSERLGTFKRRPMEHIQLDKENDERPIVNDENDTKQSRASSIRSLSGAQRIKASEGLDFQIFCDEDSIALDPYEQDDVSNNDGRKQVGFTIFDDNTQEHSAAQVESAPFTIFQDNVQETSHEEVTEETPPFTIFEDDNTDGDNGDTATLSVFGQAVAALEEVTLDSNIQKSAFVRPASKNFRADDDLTDDFTKCEHSNDTLTAASPIFGDLSQIVLEPTLTLSDVLGPKGAIRYDSLHEENIKAALRHTMEESSRNCSGDAEWGPVRDRMNKSLPKGLLQKIPTKGVKITLTEYAVSVKYELGRGVNGVVLLCTVKEDHSRQTGLQTFEKVMAVKVQSPTGCLASEFSLLQKVEQRILPRWSSSKQARSRASSLRSEHNNLVENGELTFPFPRPRCFVAFADGGLLGMTAASKSGLTLVDLVNAHRIGGGGPVPELVAMHYTTRMLMHLESLHGQGKILHCDVKPDNWVLMASAVANELDDDSLIEGAELMLVDFGRAVDLIAAADGQCDPLDLELYGNAAGEDMACVAMREERGWGCDIDTYGLCASVHVLLYGNHMEVEKDTTTQRWRPHKPFRRYWQKQLWEELFDTLLNFDRTSTHTSHPNSLRAIRHSFDKYLDQANNRNRVEAELKRQVQFLPKTR